MKKTHIFAVVSVTAMLAGTSAFAGIAQPVPEPGMFGLIVGAVAAMAIATRFIRRK